MNFKDLLLGDEEDKEKAFFGKGLVGAVGSVPLSDAVDFRSHVGRLHDPSSAFNVSSQTDVSDITSLPLAYASEASAKIGR